jgi:predicted DNA-binding transcriptional regulator AlpA
MLGLTRQRVDQLAKTDDSFPEPEVTIGRGVRVWSREAIEEWAQATGRQIVGER